MTLQSLKVANGKGSTEGLTTQLLKMEQRDVWGSKKKYVAENQRVKRFWASSASPGRGGGRKKKTGKPKKQTP